MHMEHLRTFISIPLPDKISRTVISSFKQLPIELDKLRIVEEMNLHITLKFIGDTRLDDLQKIISSLENAVSDTPSFDIQLIKGVCLPPHKPHALACAIQNNSKLTDLHKAIESELSSAGLTQPDRKKYNPHITVARVKKQNILTTEEISAIENWKVHSILHSEKIVLYESKLSSSGPTYTELQTIHLA